MQIQSSFRRARVAAWSCAFALSAILSSTGTAAAADASRALWHATPARTLPVDAPPVSAYRPLLLDVATMNALLVPARHGASVVTLSLPHPDGSFSEFQLADSRTMPDELQDKYPEIVSLSGSDDHGRKARVDLTPQGFQAMVFEQDGVWVVRPETSISGERYMSFRRTDLAVPEKGFQCSVHGDELDASGQSLLPPVPMTTTGATQRVYRAAVAANHNYVAAVCTATPTVACGLGTVVTAMNRVNQVYETELGVHMTLIANDDLIIYPSATGDPYSNSGSALNQNITNLNAVIGSANYDIGHVFTTGSGGVADLRATCTGSKAGGTTGLGNPTGDAFYIDYVAHEMGHQFGGNHTFNSTTSNCGGGNRAGSAAYEPGSGTTIMAYAGICGADNTQPHSDPYFHAKSLEEINTWISGTGGGCAAPTASTDQLPVINTASLPGGITLPKHTPFTMTGSATDADGDALTYNWEEYDLGAASTLAQGDIGTGPIFRSFNATTSGTRVFPKIETVLGAAFVLGETWPVTTRDLNFRLTVRDNHNVPGTPQYGKTVSADTVIHVTSVAGPFVVTRPNTALTWGRGESHVVTWDVAGTDVAPVNCANVAIDLSNDGGLTYAFPLAASEANDGSALIVVPAVPNTSQARVRVTCVGNVFFDASDVNFSIAATGDADPTGPTASVSPSTGFTFTLDAGTSGTDTLTVANGAAAASSLTYTIAESADSCATTTNVTWLAAAPASGSIVAGSSTPATVSINSSTLAFGTYAASLCVNSNDAAHPVLIVPVNLTVNQPANDEIFKDSFEPSGPPPQPVQDSSFEATTASAGANPFWTGSDTNPQAGGGTPFYNNTDQDIPTHTGAWAIWFGDWAGGAEVQIASQSVTIPSGAPRYLNFWQQIGHNSDIASPYTVKIDGVALQTVDIGTVATGSAYAPVYLDISAYTDGAAHTIEFRYEYSDANSAGADGEIFVDDVTVDSTHITPRAQRSGPLTRRSHKH